MLTWNRGNEGLLSPSRVFERLAVVISVGRPSVEETAWTDWRDEFGFVEKRTRAGVERVVEHGDQIRQGVVTEDVLVLRNTDYRTDP